MTRACSKIGVRLIYARPYGCEATGKIERFNRVVDSFLDEAYLVKPQTLDELNRNTVPVKPPKNKLQCVFIQIIL